MTQKKVDVVRPPEPKRQPPSGDQIVEIIRRELQVPERRTFAHCIRCGGEYKDLATNPDKVGNFGLKGSMPDSIKIYRCAKCGHLDFYQDKRDAS